MSSLICEEEARGKKSALPGGALDRLEDQRRAGIAARDMFIDGPTVNEVMEYHNFMLTQYYKKTAVDFQQASWYAVRASRPCPWTSCRCSGLRAN